MSVRVGVIGALGRVGRMVCSAVEDAPDLELVAGIDKGDSLDQLVAAGCEVVVDFTHPDVVLGDVEFLVAHGIHAVVGPTGWTPECGRCSPMHPAWACSSLPTSRSVRS